MSDETFRFVHVRPAQVASNETTQLEFASYHRTNKPPLQVEIEALTGPDARDRAVGLAQVALQSEPDAGDLEKLLRGVGAASTKSRAGDAKREFERVTGTTVTAYLASPPAQRLRTQLWERVYAHTLAPEEKPQVRAIAFEGVRAFHYLEDLAGRRDDDRPLSAARLQKVSPRVPRGIVPPAASADRTQEDEYAAAVIQELRAVHGVLNGLEASILDLQSVSKRYKGGRQRVLLDQPSNVQPAILSVASVSVANPSLDFRFEPAIATGGPVISAAAALTEESAVTRKVAVVPKKVPWHFEEFGQAELTAGTRELLAARRAALDELETHEVVAHLRREQIERTTSYLTALPARAQAYVREAPEFAELLAKVPVPGYRSLPAEPSPSPEPGSALARGIQPLGIGDLLVVRQRLLRYAAGEVAHIENVLKSETKHRKDSRLREVEETLVVDREELEETEKDLQSTDRFELQKETQRTINQQMNLGAGVSVTGSYGPVSVSAHADFALTQSSSETNRTASGFAREVTERAVSRIVNRTREQRTRKTLERFEEINEHGFDNKAGSGHVIGIYRWVDKYYKARVVNYGRRLMLEFILPEPAAFYIHILTNQALAGVTLPKPSPPLVSGRPLRPTDLNELNHSHFVAQYNVQGIDPYPAETIRVSAAFAESAGASANIDYAKSAEKLTVPKGYKCLDVFGEIGWQGYGSKYFLECFIAGQRWGSVTAEGVEGVIPISIKGYISAFHVNVVAICELTDAGRSAWQLKTYAAIMDAYERALAAYNQEISLVQLQTGVNIEGRNPDLNRQIERDELKRAALRLLTNNFAKTRVSGAWRLDEKFNAMASNGEFGYPEFDPAEALVEGRMVQFFEQAFEWTNVTYRFYPYAWARKEKWRELALRTDADPQFSEFLRAGSARVVVPVTPGYDTTVLHYLWTNEIWNGGEPPTLNDPLFISIVAELRADSSLDLDANLPSCSVDSGYPCVADEWEIKLPTSLVYLQKDAELPSFS